MPTLPAAARAAPAVLRLVLPLFLVPGTGTALSAGASPGSAPGLAAPRAWDSPRSPAGSRAPAGTLPVPCALCPAPAPAVTLPEPHGSSNPRVAPAHPTAARALRSQRPSCRPTVPTRYPQPLPRPAPTGPGSLPGLVTPVGTGRNPDGTLIPVLSPRSPCCCPRGALPSLPGLRAAQGGGGKWPLRNGKGCRAARASGGAGGCSHGGAHTGRGRHGGPGLEVQGLPRALPAPMQRPGAKPQLGPEARSWGGSGVPRTRPREQPARASCPC